MLPLDRGAAEIDVERFGAGWHLLPDLPAPAAGESWRTGDTVLLGLAIDTAAEQGEWYLRITAGERVEARLNVTMRPHSGEGEGRKIVYDLVAVSVELFDRDAMLVSQATAHMPEVSLEYGGLYEYVELSMLGEEDAAAMLAADDAADERLTRAMAGVISLMMLPHFLQRDQGVEQLLWRVIDRPGLLSVVANRGVSLGLDNIEGAEAREEPGARFGPAYRAPIAVKLNGRTALRNEMVVMQSAPPYGLCNGLLALDGAHPSDSNRRLAVRLLGASRGDPGATAAVETQPAP